MAAHTARAGLQVRAGERRDHDPQRSADQHPFRPAAAARQCVGSSAFLPSEAGEVARRAGGVMSSATDAHAPSARFAGQAFWPPRGQKRHAPSKTMGRYLNAQQARELGRKSNLVGALLVLHAWALIGASMA